LEFGARTGRTQSVQVAREVERYDGLTEPISLLIGRFHKKLDSLRYLSRIRLYVEVVSGL